jgi:hypothetical protein
MFSLSLAIGVLASALFFAGCGSSSAAAPAATPTATTPPTATPTPVLNSTYTSTDGVYTFQFPGNWASTPVNASPFVNGVILTSPDSLDVFIVLPANTGLPASQYPALFSSTLKGTGGTDIMIKSAGSQTIGMNTWAVEEGTLNIKGTAYTAAQFTLAHHGKTFIIDVLAPTATASTVEMTYFQPMIASLTFLK